MRDATAGLELLDDDGRGAAAAVADAGTANLALVQLVHQHADKTCAGRAELS